MTSTIRELNQQTNEDVVEHETTVDREVIEAEEILHPQTPTTEEKISPAEEKESTVTEKKEGKKIYTAEELDNLMDQMIADCLKLREAKQLEMKRRQQERAEKLNRRKLNECGWETESDDSISTEGFLEEARKRKRRKHCRNCNCKLLIETSDREFYS